MEPWNHGTMEPWNHGTMEPRNHGTMEPRNQGWIEPWNHGTKDGTMEHWNLGTLEFFCRRCGYQYLVIFFLYFFDISLHRPCLLIYLKYLFMLLHSRPMDTQANFIELMKTALRRLEGKSYVWWSRKEVVGDCSICNPNPNNPNKLTRISAPELIIVRLWDFETMRLWGCETVRPWDCEVTLLGLSGLSSYANMRLECARTLDFYCINIGCHHAVCKAMSASCFQ
jgi:hypothetical protein